MFATGRYDALVVGARCAGAACAMLMADVVSWLPLMAVTVTVSAFCPVSSRSFSPTNMPALELTVAAVAPTAAAAASVTVPGSPIFPA